jgi:hypothetical protein
MSRGEQRRFLTRSRPMGKVKVPVGLQKALYHAAQDDEFKARLLADPQATITESGISLRPSELAMLGAISPNALEAMIDSLVPENPRRRKFMGLVAAAAASLAAGTAIGSCDDAETDQHGSDAGGIGPDTDVDGDTDADADGGEDGGDTDTVDTETDSTWAGGAQPDDDVDDGSGCGSGAIGANDE